MIRMFGEIEIEWCKFHSPKEPISMEYVDIDKILISNKVSYYKYFIAYKNDDL